MALIGATTFANAQAQDEKGEKGKAPAATQPGAAQPGKAQPQSEPKAQPRAESGREQPKTAQPQTTQPQTTQPQTTERPKGSAQKATQERSTDRPKGTEAPKRDGDRQRSTEQQPGDKASQTPDQRKSSEQRQPGDRKSTQGPQRDTDRQKASEQQRDMDRKSAQDRDRDRGKSADRGKADQGRQGERVRVSEPQRTTVRERLTKTRVEKTRINVSINIGAAIPRSVRLRPLPVTIFEVVPEYRGFSYIVLEDETIVIVNPRTYVIVDYLPAGTQRAERPSRPHLTLSREQMRFVFSTVPKDRTAEVRARLALGAEVSRDVELLVFPSEVTARIPELDHYRYVVSHGDVIIVDPRDNEVALVINE
jgi:hypothetical protein